MYCEKNKERGKLSEEKLKKRIQVGFGEYKLINTYFHLTYVEYLAHNLSSGNILVTIPEATGTSSVLH